MWRSRRQREVRTGFAQDCQRLFGKVDAQGIPRLVDLDHAAVDENAEPPEDAARVRKSPELAHAGRVESSRSRGFRRNEHCPELSAPPGDAVHSEPRDLVVLDTVRAHVVDNGLERADRELGRHQPAS